MNTTSTDSKSHNNGSSNAIEMDSTNLLVFFLKWWKTIALFCFIAAVLGAIASFMIEEKFRSTAVVFATPQNSFGEQIFETVKKNDLLKYGEKEDAERMLQMINSDVVKNKVIVKFNLWESYNIKPEQPGANTLIGKQYSDNVEAKMTKFGSIQVSVLDKNNIQARDIANYIINVADTLSNQLKKDRAQIALDYTKETYRELKKDIQLLEDSIWTLREKGVYDYELQIEGLIAEYASAVLQGKTRQAEQLDNEMKEISRYGAAFQNLARLIEGAHDQLAIVKSRLDLMRADVNTYLPATYVVNNATESDKKAYPIRWLIVAMSVIGTFIFTVVLLLLIDSIKKVRAEGKLNS